MHLLKTHHIADVVLRLHPRRHPPPHLPLRLAPHLLPPRRLPLPRPPQIQIPATPVQATAVKLKP